MSIAGPRPRCSTSDLITHCRLCDRRTPGWLPTLKAAELFYRLLDRFHLLDPGVHGVFFKVELLGKSQHRGSMLSRHHDNTVIVRGNDISRLNRNAVDHYAGLRSSKAIVPHQCRWRHSGSKYRKPYLFEIGSVT